MRGPSIQKTAAVSVLLHLAVLVLSVVLINYSKNVFIPSPYTVNLVSSSKGRSSGERVQKAEEPKSKAVEKAKSPEEIKEVTKTDKKADDERLKNIMSELSAKNRLKLNSDLRKRMAAISVKGSSAKSVSKAPGKSGSAGGGGASYNDIIAAQIGAQIIYPETGEGQLATHVLVRILKDGTIRIMNVEKKSGNILFDRAAINAINKANPVTPPPDEMEVVLQLHPYGGK
jgi:colicin import membrane protein